MNNLFPVHHLHKGIWEGVYRHLDGDGHLLERFRSKVNCEFPENSGENDEIIYRQTTELWGESGDHSKAVFEGINRGDHLWYDTPTFFGKSWETQNNIIMLDLTRKDEPGAKFIEIIILGDDENHRSRTWHWFKNSQLYKRTICEEIRIESNS